MSYACYGYGRGPSGAVGTVAYGFGRFIDHILAPIWRTAFVVFEMRSALVGKR